ncbi:3-oxoacyl-ACP reductase family protein [Zemynaea arenosa]|nr:3-oxoacyl-ACP reductase family protein [Massilia arenosa]
MADLSGKKAFVTGGARGIGAAIVRRLARDGAELAFTYVGSRDTAEALAAEIVSNGGKAQAIQADSADAAALSGAIAKAADRMGGLDILVANAGVFTPGTIDEFKLDDFDRTLAVNVRGVFVAAQEAARHLGSGGRIITIGSTNAGRAPFPGMAPYAMSKAAVAGLVRGLARDLGPRGITVNNVQPGPVDTDMNPDSGDFAAMVRASTALNRYADVSEIAAFVAWLSSAEASYLTGASLTIDGGFQA